MSWRRKVLERAKRKWRQRMMSRGAAPLPDDIVVEQVSLRSVAQSHVIDYLGDEAHWKALNAWLEFYLDPRHANANFRVFCAKKRFLGRFLSSLIQRLPNDVVCAFGNANFVQGIRGGSPYGHVPRTFIAKMCAERVQGKLYKIDEYRTSANCSVCHWSNDDVPPDNAKMKRFRPFRNLTFEILQQGEGARGRGRGRGRGNGGGRSDGAGGDQGNKAVSESTLSWRVRPWQLPGRVQCKRRQWKILRCDRCNKVAHRDINAVINIARLYVVEHWENGRRPRAFCRPKSTRRQKKTATSSTITTNNNNNNLTR